MASNKIVEFVVKLKDKFSKNFDKLDKGLGNSKKQTKGLSDKLKVLQGVLAGVVSYKTIEFFKEWAQTAMDVEVQMKGLKSVIEATSVSQGQANATFQKYTDIMNQIQEDTTTASEDMAGFFKVWHGQASNFGFSDEQAGTFARLSNDLAALKDGVNVTSGSVEEATKKMFEAFSDPMSAVSGLREMGVAIGPELAASMQEMVDGGNNLGAQKLLFTELQERYGGYAEDLAKGTAAGRVKQLTNEYNELKIQFMDKLLPIIIKVSEKMKEMIIWLQNNMWVLHGIVTAVGLLGVVMGLLALKIGIAAVAALGLGTAMNVALVGIPLIIGGIIALVSYLKDSFDNVGDALVFVGMKILQFLLTPMTLFIDLLNTIPGINIMNPGDEIGKYADGIKNENEERKKREEEKKKQAEEEKQEEEKRKRDEKNEKAAEELLKTIKPKQPTNNVAGNKDNSNKNKSNSTSVNGSNSSQNIQLTINKLQISDKFIVNNQGDIESIKKVFTNLLLESVNDVSRQIK